MEVKRNFLLRNDDLLDYDIESNRHELKNIISSSRFMVVGAAGSIGSAVVLQLIKYNALSVYAIDISENNLAELVRDVRNSFPNSNTNFKTFSIALGSDEFTCFQEMHQDFDYIINLSAMKHVRSESNPYSLMRMIDLNVVQTSSLINYAISINAKNYFSVSSDKSVNPANAMGASKCMMEEVMVGFSEQINVSSARFANVAFSDGSILHSMKNRLHKSQPIVVPTGIKRYFISQREAGELCLMAIILGKNREIFFPKLEESKHLMEFEEIIKNYPSCHCFLKI